jgi:isocitrate dehydrogenase kinase/phosphatase
VEKIEPEALDDSEGLNETMAIIKAQVAEEAFGGDLYYKMYGCTRDEVHIRALDIIEHKLFQKNTLSHIGRK